MVDVSNSPIGDNRWTAQVHMGDPVAQPDRPWLYAIPFPLGMSTWASWNVDAPGWKAAEVIGPNELFQISNKACLAVGGVTALQGERNGAAYNGTLDWLLICGLL